MGGEKDGGKSKYEGEGEGGDWQQRLAFLEGGGSAVSAGSPHSTDGTKGGVGAGAGLLGALEQHSRASHHLSDLLAAMFRAEAEGGAGGGMQLSGQEGREGRSCSASCPRARWPSSST